MLININVNGFSFIVQPNISVLQACEMINVIIPRFCYHERLSVAGNCRMCLVEIDKMPKLQVSCSIPISPNMVVRTESVAVKKAREGVLEFLLINHPLDCPICDQGGECDLQDQTLIYGGDRSRFKEFKRALEDKDCGPLVKTIMTRCIHCTRCVRFANEVIGVPIFGTTGRGNSLEIGTYIHKMLTSELSGNIVDLCPVGALTSKPYAFLSRPWELKSIESIDIFDSIHSNIRVDVRGYDIVRILPRLNEFINEEWISDKVRFSFDGLLVQRLSKPLVKNKNGTFDIVSWNKAIELLVKKFKVSRKFSFLVGNSVDLESLIFIKKIMLLVNAKLINNLFENYLNIDCELFYKFNTLLSNINRSDLCLLIGVNPRIEGVMVNYYLRKRYLLGNFNVSYIGSQLKLTFPSFHLGSNLNLIFSVLEGTHKICKILKKSKTPIIILGKSLQVCLRNFNLDLVFDRLKKNINLISNLWNGFNCFNNYTTNFGYLSLCLNYLNYTNDKTLDVIYIVENENNISSVFSYDFMVFQGHHGCSNAQKANLILPSSSFLEKNSIYVNCEGRLQQTQSVILPLSLAKASSLILNTVFNNLLTLYNLEINQISVTELKLKDFLGRSNPIFHVLTNMPFYMPKTLYSKITTQDSYFYSSLFDNFYQTDIISQNSLNMSKSSKYLLDKNPFNSYC